MPTFSLKNKCNYNSIVRRFSNTKHRLTCEQSSQEYAASNIISTSTVLHNISKHNSTNPHSAFIHGDSSSGKIHFINIENGYLLTMITTYIFLKQKAKSFFYRPLPFFLGFTSKVGGSGR